MTERLVQRATIVVYSQTERFVCLYLNVCVDVFALPPVSVLCPAGSCRRPAAAAAAQAPIPSPLTTRTTDRTKEEGGTAATPSASPQSAPAVRTWRT